MKLFTMLLVTALSFSSQAASLEAVDCKREMIATALSERTKESTLSFLLTSTYEVLDFNYLENGSGYGDFEYVVTILSTSRVDNTTVVISYGAKVTDVKTCAVSVQILAD